MEPEERDRRLNRRFNLQLPMTYRVSQKGSVLRAGAAVTSDISVNGIRFRCRKPIPVGAHAELNVEWPAKQGGEVPVTLAATGFVVRCEDGEAVVRLASRRFRIAGIEHELAVSA